MENILIIVCDKKHTGNGNLKMSVRVVTSVGLDFTFAVAQRFNLKRNNKLGCIRVGSDMLDEIKRYCESLDDAKGVFVVK